MFVMWDDITLKGIKLRNFCTLHIYIFVLLFCFSWSKKKSCKIQEQESFGKLIMVINL